MWGSGGQWKDQVQHNLEICGRERNVYHAGSATQKWCPSKSRIKLKVNICRGIQARHRVSCPPVLQSLWTQNSSVKSRFHNASKKSSKICKCNLCMSPYKVKFIKELRDEGSKNTLFSRKLFMNGSQNWHIRLRTSDCIRQPLVHIMKH